MNIRCAFCQTPYTLSRVAMLDALQEMDSKNLTHYDAHCPRCRRATSIERKRMEMFFPNWRDALKQFEAEMKEHPQHEAPASAPTPELASVTQAESKPVPMPAREKRARHASASKAETKVEPEVTSAKSAAKPAIKTPSPKGKKTSSKSK